MKITCIKENLATALSLVTNLATKSVNLPILSNVLIKASEQKVEIISTNLELAIIVSIRAKVEEPGSFTVPARTLTDFVNLLADEKIDVELKENELVVSCGKSATKIKGIPADEYPVIPAVGEGQGFLVPVEDMKKGLSQVNLAAARNDIRPELSGVLFAFNLENSGQLVVAATDSYRLAEKKIKLLQGKESFRVIVPGRTSQEIAHILSSSSELESEKSVRIILSENQIAVNYNSVQMISRLVEGQYPDYTQIIPKDFKTSAEFSIAKMVKEIKAASLFTTVGVNAVAFDILPAEGEIKIASTSTQTGEYRSGMEAEIKGEKNAILLNHRYLLDGLNSINGDVGTLKIINSDSPCVLIGKNEENYLYIVMPIRQ
ncbi:MAG: DNA polymerase III subunit beta [Candidatus Magasanikbacteria bacterium]|nr:DNA polymerase III subunit beta [Candidatus Magasanikbacteria bacterium]